MDILRLDFSRHFQLNDKIIDFFQRKTSVISY